LEQTGAVKFMETGKIPRHTVLDAILKMIVR
jgi:hypothetical protein